MAWEDHISPDEFDRADGITVEEIIANIWERHWAGECDPMTCPICAEAAEAAKATQIKQSP